MLHSAADKYISADTVLTPEQRIKLDEVIAGKVKRLRKTRDTELALFTMEELEHLRELQAFNKRQES